MLNPVESNPVEQTVVGGIVSDVAAYGARYAKRTNADNIAGMTGNLAELATKHDVRRR